MQKIFIRRLLPRKVQQLQLNCKNRIIHNHLEKPRDHMDTLKNELNKQLKDTPRALGRRLQPMQHGPDQAQRHCPHQGKHPRHHIVAVNHHGAGPGAAVPVRDACCG